MSTPRKPKPRCSDVHSDLRRLLLATEAGHKADIHTYCSGHLGPLSLTSKQPHQKTKQCFWMMSQGGEEAAYPPLLQQTGVLANIKKMRDSLSHFTAATALAESKFWGPKQEETADSSPRTDRKEEVTPPKMALNISDSLLVTAKTQARTKLPLCEEEGQHRFWLAHSHQAGLTKKGQLRTMQRFGRQVIGKQDLWERNRMAGGKAAEMHEKKLRKELRKLSVQSWPSRDRLTVFSDVFDDVCDGSPIFGGILREIKKDYDLYLNSIMASQSSLQDMSLMTPLEEMDHGIVKPEDLEEAEKEVSRLEEEARRTLEENDRVRNEFQNLKAMRDPEDTERPLPGLLQDDGITVSSVDRLQSKRIQVWNMWKEIQQLEREIKEKMVSVITTAATERSIRDSKAEIMRLLASNDRLKNTNKDLENNINIVLNREKASAALRQAVWEKCSVNRG
ncbi:uncharacterized protein C6orf118-like [Polymixia lowei]